MENQDYRSNIFTILTHWRYASHLLFAALNGSLAVIDYRANDVDAMTLLCAFVAGISFATWVQSAFIVRGHYLVEQYQTLLGEAHVKNIELVHKIKTILNKIKESEK